MKRKWSSAKKEIKKRRRFANALKEKKGILPTPNLHKDGKTQMGHSNIATNIYCFDQDKTGHRVKHVIVGTRTHFYNPAHNIAKQIQRALDPDNPENDVDKGKVSGQNGPAGTTVRGEMVEETNYGIKIFVYGKSLWLKKKWVEVLGGGRLRILNQAYNQSRRLRGARKKREQQREQLLR